MRTRPTQHSSALQYGNSSRQPRTSPLTAQQQQQSQQEEHGQRRESVVTSTHKFTRPSFSTLDLLLRSSIFLLFYVLMIGILIMQICQVPYRLRPLRSKTGQLRFGTTTTCTRKSTSPSIPIGLARPFLHPHRIPDPAPISLSLDSSRLHYSFVPFRFTIVYADPRVWMHSTAMRPLHPLRP
jgi:hypothetical protein